MKRVLLLLSCLIISSDLIAQSLSNRDKRKFYADVINAVEVYELSSTVRDEGAKYNFISLFKNPETKIYCDLIDYYSMDNEIGVIEYLDLLSKKNLVEVEIKDLSRGNLQLKDDGWHMKVSFLKKINYMDENDVWFSSEEYYRQNYRIMMDFVYDEANGKCYVADIDGEMKSNVAHLPQEFMVVQYSSKKDLKLRIVDESLVGNAKRAAYKEHVSLRFNEFNQAYVTPSSIHPWNDNIRIKYDTLAKSRNYNHVKLKYKVTPWRVKMRGAYAPKAYKYDDGFDGAKDFAYEVGLDLGITFSMGSSTQMGFYAGIAKKYSNIRLTQESINYNVSSYSSDKVGDNAYNGNIDKIQKKYSISNLRATESLSFEDWVVPAYFGLDHRLGNVVSLTWSAGVKLYLNTKVTGRDYTLNYGWKSADDSAVPSEETMNVTKLLFPCDYKPNNGSNLSVVGSLGLNFNLYKKYIYLTTRVGYEYGLQQIHTGNSTYFSDQDKQYPLLIYPAEKHVATNSLLNCVSFSRQALWFETGLIFNF